MPKQGWSATMEVRRWSGGRSIFQHPSNVPGTGRRDAPPGTDGRRPFDDVHHLVQVVILTWYWTRSGSETHFNNVFVGSPTTMTDVLLWGLVEFSSGHRIASFDFWCFRRRVGDRGVGDSMRLQTCMRAAHPCGNDIDAVS